MPLDAGRLRHVIAIQQKTETQDQTTGGVSESWTTISGYGEIRAAIEPLSAREFLQSRADQSEVRARITIRYMPGLDASMRFLGLCDCHLNKVYNPAGLLEDNESGVEWITAPCSEGVNEG